MSPENFRLLASTSRTSTVQPLWSRTVVQLGGHSNGVAQASATAHLSAFPVEHIGTGIPWNDLVLHPDTMRAVQALAGQLASGCRVVFYGPAGAGKTLTATLLGTYTGRDVMRINLSQMVARHSAEAEKNLARLFELAESKNWILFFDEAEALFGKRTTIRNAHDKYANQEAIYLLQRLEEYKGVVILAATQRANLDEAFLRRFQAVIQFPVPRVEERVAIWQQAFLRHLNLAPDIDWHRVAVRYDELTGADILQVAHCCAAELAATNSHKLTGKQLEEYIRRECGPQP